MILRGSLFAFGPSMRFSPSAKRSLRSGLPLNRSRVLRSASRSSTLRGQPHAPSYEISTLGLKLLATTVPQTQISDW